LSNNKTIPLAALGWWAELCRTPSRRDAAIDKMVKHISKPTQMRKSLTPEMVLKACDLTEGRFHRFSEKERAERCFRSLCETYRDLIRPSAISEPILMRLRALSEFVAQNRIPEIRRQPRLHLPGPNNLRISLPVCYIAKISGKRVLIALFYDNNFPIHDGAGLTADGKTVYGGLSLFFEKGKVRGSAREIFDLPSDIHEILAIDASKAKWSRKVRLVWLKPDDLFLAPYRLDFLAKRNAVSLLYSDACKKLGIDDGGHGGGDGAPDESGEADDGKPTKKSA